MKEGPLDGQLVGPPWGRSQQTDIKSASFESLKKKCVNTGQVIATAMANREGLRRVSVDLRGIMLRRRHDAC